MDRDGVPGWYPPSDIAELERLTMIASRVEGIAVEFGSYAGRSACVIAPLIGRRLCCVDTWNWTAHGETGDTIYEAFLRNTRHLDVEAFRMDWRSWCRNSHPYGARIALAHIDADHSYPEVADSIQTLLPRMAEGGILCGHDYGWDDGSHPGVRQAVDELLPHRHVGGVSVWSIVC